MYVLRIGSNLISVHNGPTNGESPWQNDLLVEIAYDILDRVGG